MTGLDPLQAEPMPQPPQGPQPQAQEPQGQALPAPQGPQTEQDPQVLADLGRVMQGIAEIPDAELGIAEDQHEQEMLQTVLGDIIGEMVDEENQKAQSFGEKLEWNVSSLAKAAADGIPYTVGTSLKLMAGMSTFANELDFTKGYRQIEDTLLKEMGATDPDSIDTAHYVARKMGLIPDSSPINAGQVADELIAKRLGADAVYSQTVGFMASFMTAPGRALGEAGAEMTMPLSRVAERWLAKKAIDDPKLAQKILDSGDIWSAIASTPKWKETATMMQRMAAAGGKNAKDVIGTTGANILQSYAMSSDDERVNQMIAAAWMSPFMVPVARVGQRIGESIITGGMSKAASDRLISAFNKWSSGKMTAKELDTIAKQSSPVMVRGMASAVTSAFEGTAFTMLTPDAQEMFGKWLDGDSDAGADLLRLFASTSMGVAATKFAIPTNLAPMFKQLRPDINNLRLRMDAEANRLASEQLAKERGIDNSAEIDEYLDGRIPANEADALKQRSAEAEARYVGLVDQAQGKVEDAYSWAEGDMLAPIKGQWESEFVELQGPTANGKPLNSGSVRLRFDDNHAVTLSKGVDGQPSLTVPGNVIDVLSSVTGADTTGTQSSQLMSGRSSEAGKNGDVIITGEAARKTLDDLALLGILMNNMGSLTYQRMGMEEVHAGKWSYKGGDEHYTMDLDGKSTVTSPLDNSVIRKDNNSVIGGFNMDIVWDGPAASALHEALMAKRALSPDPLVDGILSNAIITARYVEGPTGDMVRAYFDSVDPQALIGRLSKEGDRLLALDLGTLTTGTNNLEMILRDTAMDAINKQAEAEVDAQFEFADAMNRDPGGISDEVVPKLQAERLAKEMESKKELAQEQQAATERQNYLDALEEAVAFEKQIAAPDEPSAEVAQNPDPLPKPVKSETGPIKMSADQIAVLSRFIPKNSALGKQIAAFKGGRGEVNVTLKEIADLAKKWVKYAPTELEKAADNVLYKRQAQSADAWMQSALDALGINYEKRAMSGAPRYISLNDQVSKRMRDPGKKPPEVGEGRPGRQDVIREQLTEAAVDAQRRQADLPDEALSGIPKELTQALGKSAKSMTDYIARDMADVLRRKGVDFGERTFKSRTRAAQIEGRSMEHAAKMQELSRAKETKAEFKKLSEMQSMSKGKDSMERSRLSDLIDGTVKPETPLEKEVADAGQKFNASLRDAASDAGSLRAKKNEKGEDYFEPVRKGGKSVMQHVQGKDLWRVMDKPELREAFLNDLAKANDLWTVGEDGARRRVTGEDLNNEWLQRTKNKGKITSDADKQAAVEFTRRFQQYPEVWKAPNGKRYEIQETNIWQKMRGIAVKQSGRAAAVEEFGTTTGSDAGDQKLIAIAKAEGWEPQFIRALEKGGVERTISDTAERLRSTEDSSVVDDIKRQMELLAARNQGSELIQTVLQKVNPDAAIGIRSFQALRAASLSSLSFIRDIPDMIRGAVFLGGKRYFQAINSLAGSTKEFKVQLERDGVLQHQIGDWVFQEARGLLAATASRIGKVASMTERAKSVLAAKQVELMINDINIGKGTERDFYFVEKMLGIDGLRGQKIDGNMKTRLMQEGTAFLTSRTKKGAYSRFADDPRIAEIMVFQRFATKRLESHIKVVEAVFSSAKEHGWKSPQSIEAQKMAARNILGITAMGISGDWLVEGLIGLATEGDADGFKQFYNEMVASPQAFYEQWAKSVKNQTVGGPASTVVRMFEEPEKVKTWTDTTSIGALAYAITVGYNEMMDGDTNAIVHLFENTGLIPARRIFNGWARAGWLGQDPDIRRASQQVWNWRRENNLMPAGGGDRVRPDEFYDATSKAINALQNNSMDVDKALAETSTAIAEALSLAPSQSVAASIRGHRLVANLNPIKRQELFAALNDEEQIRKILQFDDALSDMARRIGKMEGTRESQFAETMQAVAKQATYGTKDQWSEVAEMAIDDAAVGVAVGTMNGPEIQEFARHFTQYPEHFDTVFSGRDLSVLRRIGDSSSRADMIWRLLMRRARDRVRSDRRTERKLQSNR